MNLQKSSYLDLYNVPTWLISFYQVPLGVLVGYNSNFLSLMALGSALKSIIFF